MLLALVELLDRLSGAKISRTALAMLLSLTSPIHSSIASMVLAGPAAVRASWNCSMTGIGQTNGREFFS